MTKLYVIIHPKRGVYVAHVPSGPVWSDEQPAGGMPGGIVTAGPREAWGTLPKEWELVEVPHNNAKQSNFDPRFKGVPLADVPKEALAKFLLNVLDR